MYVLVGLLQAKSIILYVTMQCFLCIYLISLKQFLYSLRHVIIGDLPCIARCNKINPALVFNLIISGKLSAT